MALLQLLPRLGGRGAQLRLQGANMLSQVALPAGEATDLLVRCSLLRNHPFAIIFNHMVEYAPALDDVFAALGDPTRRAIVAKLRRGESTVTDVAAPFEMSLNAVSKHLKVLERAGLIARGRDAQRRPCRLEAGRLEEIDAWLSSYRRFWEHSYARLDDYLVEMQRTEKEKEKKHDRKKP